MEYTNLGTSGLKVSRIALGCMSFGGGGDVGGGWSLDSGAFPPGMGMDGLGRITGTPTASGDYTVSISYFVALKGTRTRTYTLHVAP